MARYVYIGPPEQRGQVPGHGFEEGVLSPDHVRQLIERGHLRDLSVPLEPESEPDPVEAAEQPDPAPSEKPLAKMNKAELQAAAAALGLNVDGTNRELADRIAAARAAGA